MNLFDELLRAHAASFALETARVAGLVVVAPLPWVYAPLRVRAVIVLGLAFTLHGAGVPLALRSPSLATIGAAVPVEFVLGACMGFVLRLAAALAEIAGELIATSMGLSMAQVFDPTRQLSETALSRVLVLLGGLLIVLLGGPEVALRGLAASFEALPPGALLALPDVSSAMVELVARAIEAAVRLALPVLAVLFVAQLGLAMVSRAAPAMQLFSIGFAVTIALGFAVLDLSAPELLGLLGVESARLLESIEPLLLAFVRG